MSVENSTELSIGFGIGKYELRVISPKQETGNGQRRAFRRRYVGRDERRGWRGSWEEESDVPRSVIVARFGSSNRINIEELL